jgi:hypothetical protein
MSPSQVQPAPGQAAGRVQDTATLPHRSSASTPTYAEVLAAQWCRDTAALVGELRALRWTGRRRQ